MRHAIAAAVVVMGTLVSSQAGPVALAGAGQIGPAPSEGPRLPPRVPIGYAPEPEGTPLRLVGRRGSTGRDSA
jgi:hypothetical protein